MENQISGIYCITNTIDNKKYIGSSKDIGYRFKHHLYRLNNNRHTNSHLQNAVNKYGISNFTFSILEQCSKETLIEREQFYIDQESWEMLYNKTRIAYGGGSDAVEKPLYLLDLSGNIVDKFKSGTKLARFLNRSILSYNKINTSAIIKKKYRVVSVEFYETSLDVIKTWKSYSNYSVEKTRLYSLYKYKVVKDNQETLFNTKKALSTFIGISHQRVNQIFKYLDSKGLTNYLHKKTGFSIQYVIKKD